MRLHPEQSGTRSYDRAEPFIPFRFVAGALTGLGTTQLPIYDSSNSSSLSLATEGIQMPGHLRMQLVPDQFAMMKLTSVGEDRVYSDA